MQLNYFCYFWVTVFISDDRGSALYNTWSRFIFIVAFIIAFFDNLIIEANVVLYINSFTCIDAERICKGAV